MRSLPRTARTPPTPRARSIAVGTALILAAIGVAVPNASADDLREKQKQARGQVRHAQGDLHESSEALAAAAQVLTRARAALSAAQSRLATAQADVTAAVRLDTLMQQRLAEAERRLALARVALDTARQKVVDQRAEIGVLAASNYANGDPDLVGLAVMLNSQDPAEVTSQMNTVDTLMDKQTTLLAALKEARARMVAEEAKVALRGARRDANEMLKEALKEKTITEDDERKGLKLVQDTTDKSIAKVDEIVAKKEGEILEV